MGGKRPGDPWGFVVKGPPSRGGYPWLGGKRPGGSWWFGAKGPPSRGGCPWVGGNVVKGPPSRGGCPWLGGKVPSMCCLFEERGRGFGGIEGFRGIAWERHLPHGEGRFVVRDRLLPRGERRVGRERHLSQGEGRVGSGERRLPQGKGRLVSGASRKGRVVVRDRHSLGNVCHVFCIGGAIHLRRDRGRLRS